jgi:colanic acid/amylovoran biosynthesis glycosyltransferase
MNIAIVVNAFPENSETFIINKVLALANVGNKVTVIRLNNTGNNSLLDLYKFDKFGVEIRNANLPSSLIGLFLFSIKHPLIVANSSTLKKKKLLNNIKNNFFLSLFNNNHFDIIHFEFSGLAVSFLDILNNIKPITVLSCRGSAEKVKILTEPLRAEKLQLAFDAIDAIHCVSNDMQQTIAPLCNDQKKIFVNRPAIDATFFKPNKIASEFDGVTILSIGRFTFQKGYLIGILAIKKLVEKGIKFQWNIIGDGPQLEEMQFHIHALNLGKHIILLGKKNKNEVYELMTRSNIFLLTSVYEGIPNVVLEAMAMELPVITTRSGGVDEVIEHGKDGFIAELYDIESISKLIEQVSSNKNLAEQMGKAARLKILAEYTIQRQVEIFEKNYKQLLNK